MSERKVLLVAFLEKRSAPGHAGPQEEEEPEWSGCRTRRKHGQAAFLCVFMAKAKMGGAECRIGRFECLGRCYRVSSSCLVPGPG